MTKNQKVILGVLVAIVLALGGYLFYQNQKLKSPEYSMELLRTAAVKHNWLEVNERMDLDALYVQAFDEVIAPSLGQSSGSAVSDVMQGVLGRMRNNFVKSMLSYSKYALESTDPNTVAPPEQIFARRFVDITHLPHCYLKSVNSSQVKDDKAMVQGTLVNKLLGEEFPVSVEMTKLPDNTWKLVKINKLPELISAMDIAQKKKLVDINKPITEELNKQLTLKSSTFDLVKRQKPWVSTRFTYTPTFSISGTKAVQRFMGEVEVLGQDNKVLYAQKYIKEGPWPQGSTQTFTLNWTLNPFQAKEKVLIDLTKADLTIRETILSITFTDGSTLQTLDTLPNPKSTATEKPKK